MCARRVLASVLPVLSGMGTSQQGPVMSAASPRAAVSQSIEGLAVVLIEEVYFEPAIHRLLSTDASVPQGPPIA